MNIRKNTSFCACATQMGGAKFIKR